jgi:alkanesulfonate monooxygenase SsuD/methylene tetrahydromethanopterin reductase-like flavin-dependent oxidoreductase (luciferase family)
LTVADPTVTNRRIPIGIKTSPQAVDWATLDGAWARIGEHDVFDSVWMNDHLTDISQPTHGPSFESLTAMAALIHRVPGKVVGHAVLSATFRHPAVLAKAATVLDHATQGRFVLGLGAGWHEGEHLPFGIPMPPMPERFDRFESAVHVLKALWSEAAATPPGVTRPDAFYPLAGATNEPPPRTPGGPKLWLGGQKRRGLALAAAVADGWPLPAIINPGQPSDLSYFAGRRDAILAALDERGRDPSTFEIVSQVGTGDTGEDRAWALGQARAAVELGATQVILGMPARLGASGVDDVVRDIARPLRETLGG